MKHFVLVYDRPAGALRKIEEFDDAHLDEAARTLLALELQERMSTDVEVVMIDAPSREALEHTHSQYFFMQKPEGWLTGRVPRISGTTKE